MMCDGCVSVWLCVSVSSFVDVDFDIRKILKRLSELICPIVDEGDGGQAADA